MRVLLCLLLLPGLAAAEIYRWTDANGQVHFGQRPAAAGAEKVEVKPQVVERDQLTREREERTNRFYDARRDEQAQVSAVAAEKQAKRAEECHELRKNWPRSLRGEAITAPRRMVSAAITAMSRLIPPVSNSRVGCLNAVPETGLSAVVGPYSMAINSDLPLCKSIFSAASNAINCPTT